VCRRERVSCERVKRGQIIIGHGGEQYVCFACLYVLDVDLSFILDRLITLDTEEFPPRGSRMSRDFKSHAITAQVDGLLLLMTQCARTLSSSVTLRPVLSASQLEKPLPSLSLYRCTVPPTILLALRAPEKPTAFITLFLNGRPTNVNADRPPRYVRDSFVQENRKRGVKRAYIAMTPVERVKGHDHGSSFPAL